MLIFQNVIWNIQPLLACSEIHETFRSCYGAAKCFIFPPNSLSTIFIFSKNSFMFSRFSLQFQDFLYESSNAILKQSCKNVEFYQISKRSNFATRRSQTKSKVCRTIQRSRNVHFWYFQRPKLIKATFITFLRCTRENLAISPKFSRVHRRNVIKVAFISFGL